MSRHFPSVQLQWSNDNCTDWKRHHIYGHHNLVSTTRVPSGIYHTLSLLTERGLALKIMAADLFQRVIYDNGICQMLYFILQMSTSKGCHFGIRHIIYTSSVTKWPWPLTLRQRVHLSYFIYNWYGSYVNWKPSLDYIWTFKNNISWKLS